MTRSSSPLKFSVAPPVPLPHEWSPPPPVRSARSCPARSTGPRQRAGGVGGWTLPDLHHQARHRADDTSPSIPFPLRLYVFRLDENPQPRMLILGSPALPAATNRPGHHPESHPVGPRATRSDRARRRRGDPDLADAPVARPSSIYTNRTTHKHQLRLMSGFLSAPPARETARMLRPPLAYDEVIAIATAISKSAFRGRRVPGTESPYAVKAPLAANQSR